MQRSLTTWCGTVGHDIVVRQHENAALGKATCKVARPESYERPLGDAAKEWLHQLPCVNGAAKASSRPLGE
jgi:hypothetical protein